MKSFYNLFYLIVIQLIALKSAQSANLKCNFRPDGWDFAVKNAYICHASPVNFKSKVSIISIEGKHTQPKTNDNVNSLLIRNENCHFFPSGIEKFFANLEGIAVQNSALKVIRKGDLKPFMKLKSLSLYGNDLKSLEFQLFKFNKKLQHFSAYSNKITNIAEDLLDGMNDMQQINLNGNVCIDLVALKPSYLKNFKETINKTCPSTVDMKNYQDLEFHFEAMEIEIAKLTENLQSKSLELAVCNTKPQVVDKAVFDPEKCDSNYQKLAEIVGKFDIECDDYYESTCIANDVIIQYENMEPRSIAMVNGTVIDRDDIQELEIHGKNVHFMPKNLGIFFKNLKNLTISGTKISQINETSLKNLISLQFLSLAENKIQKIHEEAFDDLKNCEYLDLSFNKITEIPKTFSNMVNLRELNLEENQIAALNWSSFENLNNLEVLNFRANKLMQIGSNLKLNSLQELDVNENLCVDLKYPIDKMDDLIQTFDENCTVEVELKCEFMTIENDYICRAVNFNSDSENTKISKVNDQHVAKNVTKFSSINQNVKFIPQNLQEVFPNMLKLEIISSNLKKISQISKLTWMKIIGNDLEVLDESFSLISAPDLEFIDLSDNKITRIPQNFLAGLKNLKFINLSGNFLKEISENLIENGNTIEEFYCNNNKLQKVANEFIKKLNNSNVIELTGNGCVDNKFNRSADNPKKYSELYGEVDLFC